MKKKEKEDVGLEEEAVLEGNSSEEVTIKGTSIPVESSSIKTFTGGGGMVTTGGWGTTLGPGWPTTTTTTLPGMTGVVSPPTIKRKIVSLPTEVTEKILLAFLDPNEEDEEKNVRWAKILKVKDVDIDISLNPHDESVITIQLSLGDWYGNEDSED